MEDFTRIADRDGGFESYRNDTYQVSLMRDAAGGGGLRVIWLAIRRLDGQAIHDWRDLQTIKNLLVGPNYEAIEIYPAEDRAVDFSNSYHLWVFDDPTFRLPLGFRDRIISDQSLAERSEGNGNEPREAAGLDQQRPFADPPADCVSAMQARRRYVRTDKPLLTIADLEWLKD